LTGDWRIDKVKLLYAFCREFKCLPSDVEAENPIIISHMLRIHSKHNKELRKMLDDLNKKR